jgi:hypothetical protein
MLFYSSIYIQNRYLHFTFEPSTRHFLSHSTRKKKAAVKKDTARISVFRFVNFLRKLAKASVNFYKTIKNTDCHNGGSYIWQYIHKE